MATYFAQANGNITDIEWDTAPGGGGTDLTWAELQATDILCANNHTITINGAVTCARISNNGETIGTAGGVFNVGISTTLACNIVTGAVPCVVSTVGVGDTLTVNGSVTGGTAANAHAIRHNGAGTIAITGTNVYGGTVSPSAKAAYLSTANATLTVVAVTVRAQYGHAINMANVAGCTITVTATSILGGNTGSSAAIHVVNNCVLTVTATTISGGALYGAFGISAPASNAATINAANLIASEVAMPVDGRIRYVPGSANYIQMRTTGGATLNFPVQLAAADIREGVISGTVTGTVPWLDAGCTPYRLPARLP